MPSGLSDTVVNAVLNKIIGASADNTIVGANLYMAFCTSAPSDDNGTGLVEWTQGRSSAIATVNGTNWPAASGRTKVGANVTMPANASGSPIDVVFIAFFDASTVGNYRGGAAPAGGTLTVPNGVAEVITPTLAAPSP